MIVIIVIVSALTGCFITDMMYGGSITIDAPEEDEKVNTKEIQLTGNFHYSGDRNDDEEEYTTDPFKVIIEVNSEQQGKIESKSETVYFDQTITLKEGANTISVTGYYLGDEIRSREITVTCDTTAPAVQIISENTSPITAGILSFSGTVETKDLQSLEAKTYFKDSSDPGNIQYIHSDYGPLGYDDDGNWEVDYQNISRKVYINESSSGDPFTLTIRAVDDVDNSSEYEITIQIFKPE